MAWEKEDKSRQAAVAAGSAQPCAPHPRRATSATCHFSTSSPPKITFCCALAAPRAETPALPSPAPVSPAAIRTNNTNKPLMQSLGYGLPGEWRAEAPAAPASANASMDPVAPGEGFGGSFWPFVHLSVTPPAQPREAGTSRARCSTQPPRNHTVVCNTVDLFIYFKRIPNQKV